MRSLGALDGAVQALRRDRPELAGNELCRFFTPLLLSDAMASSLSLSQRARGYFKRAITILAYRDCKKCANMLKQGLYELSPFQPHHKLVRELGFELAENLGTEDFERAAESLEKFGNLFTCLGTRKSIGRSLPRLVAVAP